MGLYSNKPLCTPSPELLKQRRIQERIRRKLEDEQERVLGADEKKKKLRSEKRKRPPDFKTNAGLQASSHKLLRSLLAEYKIKATSRNIFAAVLKAKLGRRFSRQKRADKLRILACGCAVYHELAAQPNPQKAVQLLAESMGVNIGRISDPCRIIVEFLIDYGSSQEEKARNRQFAAIDAKALNYVVREGMTPQQVLTPAKGESLTVWADREAEHRSRQRPARKRAQKAPAAAVLPAPPPGRLAAVELPQAAYNALAGLISIGLAVVAPKGGGNALALAVAPLKGLTADQAKTRPAQVYKAVRRALKKAAAISVAKPATPPSSDKRPNLVNLRRDKIVKPSSSPDQPRQSEW